MKHASRWPHGWMGLLCLLLLSGCTEAPAARHASPAIGLDLEVPAELPAPGLFAEDEAEIDKLSSFLVEEGRQILAECGDASLINVVEKYVLMEKHLHALNGLIQACGEPLRRSNDDTAQGAMNEGTEAAIQKEIYDAARSTQNAVADSLSKQMPGSPLEAQILVELMQHHEWNLASIETALSYWPLYQQDESRDLLLLMTAFLGLQGAIGDANGMLLFLERYPWNETSCEAIDLAALSQSVEGKLNQAVELATNLGEPEDSTIITKKYGRLMRANIPEFDYFRNQSWGVALLHMEVVAETQIAYWENLTAAAWPSMEEGRYLLAKFRNDTRTLWTERFIHPYIFYFEDEQSQRMVSWETDIEAGAPAFMGTMAARWPFADLRCG